jgi:DnaJ-domain-containing protein 1
MPDYFAALAQPRRPWLDDDALKEAFHRASAALHPDVAGTGDARSFADANAAYGALREPGGRLRHLLELEAPEELARPQPIPSDFGDFFLRVAELRGALDAFQKKQALATGALASALLAEERLSLEERIDAVRAELDAACSAALDALRILDGAWETRPADAFQQLAALHHRFAYLSKWRAQLQEAAFKLSN